MLSQCQPNDNYSHRGSDQVLTNAEKGDWKGSQILTSLKKGGGGVGPMLTISDKGRRGGQPIADKRGRVAVMCTVPGAVSINIYPGIALCSFYEQSIYFPSLLKRISARWGPAPPPQEKRTISTACCLRRCWTRSSCCCRPGT